jgi:hypothetical protein
MPFSMVEKIVTRTAATQMKNSNGEIRQYLYTSEGLLTRSATAWIMTAEIPAVGIQKKAGVRPYRETMTIMPQRIPAAGVRTPDLDLRAEREKEPVAG